MKNYVITTSSTCITEYRVRAKSKKDAEERCQNGEVISTKDIDFKNEEVIEIREEK